MDAALAHGAPGTQSSHRVGGLPRAPANFRLEPATGTNLRLIWDDPNDPSITGYQFRLQRAEDDEDDWRPNWTDITGSDATTTSVATTNLSGGVAVVVELRAENPLGHGPAAQATGTTPGGTDPNPPLSPNPNPSRNLNLSRRPNPNPLPGAAVPGCRGILVLALLLAWVARRRSAPR